MQLQPRAAGICSSLADCGALSLAACGNPAWLEHLRKGEAHTHLSGALWLPNAAATAAAAAAAAAPASRGLHLVRSAVCMLAHQPVASFVPPAVCSMPRINVRVTVQDACSGLVTRLQALPRSQQELTPTLACLEILRTTSEAWLKDDQLLRCEAGEW